MPEPAVVLRVLHLITGLQTGGAERMLEKLVTSSDPSRYQHTVVSLKKDGPVGAALRRQGHRVICLDMQGVGASAAGVRRLVRLLRTERPHLVQTWLYYADFVGTLAALVARGPKLAWNVRNSAVHSRFGRMALPILGLLSRLPAAVVVNSHAGQSSHEAIGYRPRRWEVLPNGFDLNTFRPDPAARAAIREELGIRGEELVVVHVGRFHPNKRHLDFMRAAALVRQKIPARFVLIGRGVDQRNVALRALIDQLGLGDSVQLLGERADVPSVLAAADVFASSSAVEGFPNAIGEAMCCALPCVVTDVGDSAFIVGETGLVTAVDDPRAMAAAVVQMLAMPASERARLGEAARRRVSELFSLDAIVRRYESLYASLCCPA